MGEHTTVAGRERTVLSVSWIVFGLVMLVQTSWFRHTKSITFDETYFLSCGLQTIHDGRLDSRICSQGVAPLPILLDYLLPLSFVGVEARPTPWEGQAQDARLIYGPRLANSLLVGLPLVFVVSWWLFKRRGVMAGIVGAGLIAFSPSVVAHASLATTDSCFALFGMLALAAISWYFHQPSRWRFVIMAVAIASAMAAKYSGVFLLPVVALMFVFRTGWSMNEDGHAAWMPWIRYLATRGAALAVLIVFFWWGLHLFSFTGPLKNVPLEDTPDWSPWVKILGRGPVVDELMRVSHEVIRRPAPFDGVLFQYLHNKGGHCAFFAGQYSETGWWYYFPCAFAMKSTPVELLLALGLVVLAASALRAPARNWRKLDVDIQVLGLAILIFSGLVMTSSINIGHRYILILYPILIVAVVDRLWEHFGRWGSSKVYLAMGLLVVQGISCLSVAPHYLAYFNSFVGGPTNGRYYLLDSNIDWGQDLPALRSELQRMGRPRTAIRYFGTAVPRAYGVEADPVPGLARSVENYEVLAISVSPLHGLYVRGEDPFRCFREMEPVGYAGYSMLLFDLGSPEARDALQQAITREGLDGVKAEAD